MTDQLNPAPPYPPSLRALGPRTASGFTNITNNPPGPIAVYMGFSYPGAVALLGPGVSYHLPRNYSGYVYAVSGVLGTADSSSNDMTLGFWLNGTEFTTITIPSGLTQALAQCPGTGAWTIPGTLTDYFQVSVDVYGGSSAANLTWFIHAF